MKNNTILIVVVVLVLIVTGVYKFSGQKNVELPTGDEQQIVDNSIQQETNPNQKVFTVVSTESKATYEIDEDLRGKRTHVVGNTSMVTGQIVMNTNSKKIEAGEVKVDANTFKTDIEARDNNVKELVLKSNQPAGQFITFKATKVEGGSIETGTESSVNIIGDVTILGVTKSITLAGIASMSIDGTLAINANTVLTYGDFGVTIPDFPFLANVDKTVKLSVHLVAR